MQIKEQLLYWDPYLSVLWLRSIKISTDPDIPSELHTRHEISNKNIPFVHKLHIKEVCKRLGVKDSNNVGINIGEERESWRDIGAKNCAPVLLYSLL